MSHLLVCLHVDIIHHHLQLLRRQVRCQVVLLVQIRILLDSWVGSLQGVLDVWVLVQLVELKSQTVQTKLLQTLQVTMALIKLPQLVLLQPQGRHKLATLDKLLVDQLLMHLKMTWHYTESLWLVGRLRALVTCRWRGPVTLVDLVFLGRGRLHLLHLLF